ncbi:hypothetical protein OQA88_7615 [Cercophora sp. LCS_1]
MSGTAPINALRGGSKVLQTLSRSAGARRCLSTTQARSNGEVITFNRESSPELKSILEEIREKIILPTYLSPDQRKKIYNPKHKARLERDPITIEIDGKIHEFRYTNMVTDLPNTRKLVSKALLEMKTSTDYKNIPHLLEGLCVRARRKLPDAYFTKMVRIACMNGHSGMIVEMLKLPKRTGFQLTTHETIAELLTWLQYPAVEKGWEEKATLKAYNRVNLVLELLETENLHTNKYARHPSEHLAFPFYRDPQFLAARLHLAAAQAVHSAPETEKEKKEQEAKVKEVTAHAQQLLKLWPKNAGVLDLHPAEAHADKNALKYQMMRSTFVWHVSPVLNGLRLAQKVVGPQLAKQLEARAKKVEQELNDAVAQIQAEGRGRALYQKLFGETQTENTTE